MLLAPRHDYAFSRSDDATCRADITPLFRRALPCHTIEALAMPCCLMFSMLLAHAMLSRYAPHALFRCRAATILPPPDDIRCFSPLLRYGYADADADAMMLLITPPLYFIDAYAFYAAIA